MSRQSYIAQCHADIARLVPAACAAGIPLIGEPRPAGDRLYGIARQLARPVARGYTTKAHAVAALLVAASRARDKLGPCQVPDIFRGMQDTFNASLAREIESRELTTYRIKRTLAPLIGQHKPRNVLLAEAHGTNGRDGFPLTETEVEEIAASEVWYALPAASGRRYGR